MKRRALSIQLLGAALFISCLCPSLPFAAGATEKGLSASIAMIEYSLLVARPLLIPVAIETVAGAGPDDLLYTLDKRSFGDAIRRHAENLSYRFVSCESYSDTGPDFGAGFVIYPVDCIFSTDSLDAVSEESVFWLISPFDFETAGIESDGETDLQDIQI